MSASSLDMPAGRGPIAQRPPSARSKVANGKQLVGGIDGRSAGARRFKDLCTDLAADLGGDLGEAQRLEIRTVAGIVVHAEQLTAAMINGQKVDTEQLIRLANTANRMLNALRSKRQPRKRVSPRAELDAYLSRRSGELAE
jgi:hypothetical protein